MHSFAYNICMFILFSKQNSLKVVYICKIVLLRYEKTDLIIRKI